MDDDMHVVVCGGGVIGGAVGFALSRRGVANSLNALEAAGLIAREPGGCDGATRYWLLLDRPGPAMNCPGAKREDGSNDGP